MLAIGITLVALLAAIPGHGVPLLDPLSNGWEGWTGGELLTALLVVLAIVFLLVHYAAPARVVLYLAYWAAWAFYLQALRAAAIHRASGRVDERRLRSTFG